MRWLVAAVRSASEYFSARRDVDHVVNVLKLRGRRRSRLWPTPSPFSMLRRRFLRRFASDSAVQVPVQVLVLVPVLVHAARQVATSCSCTRSQDRSSVCARRTGTRTDDAVLKLAVVDSGNEVLRFDSGYEQRALPQGAGTPVPARKSRTRNRIAVTFVPVELRPFFFTLGPLRPVRTDSFFGEVSHKSSKSAAI
jgi:hypothetical protein